MRRNQPALVARGLHPNDTRQTVPAPSECVLYPPESLGLQNSLCQSSLRIDTDAADRGDRHNPVGKPRLLDAYCSAGGATRGYQLAGFHVTGVDIKPQPRYCGDHFIQDDAIEYIREHGREFDCLAASPPCQTHIKGLAAVNASLGRVQRHLDLIAVTRDALQATERPYVIENVEGAPLRNAVRLCGSSFGLPIRRHRLFESSAFLFGMPCYHSWQFEPKYWTSWRPNGEHRLSTVVQVYGNGGNAALWADALGIDWMSREELAEAIPPRFTEFVGGQLIRAICSTPRASAAGGGASSPPALLGAEGA